MFLHHNEKFRALHAFLIVFPWKYSDNQKWYPLIQNHGFDRLLIEISMEFFFHKKMDTHNNEQPFWIVCDFTHFGLIWIRFVGVLILFNKFSVQWRATIKIDYNYKHVTEEKKKKKEIQKIKTNFVLFSPLFRFHLI